MIKFIKREKVPIIIILLLFIWGAYNGYSYIDHHKYNNSHQIYYMCLDDPSFLAEYGEICAYNFELMEKYEKPTSDSFSVFYNLVNGWNLKGHIFIFPLLIMILAVYQIQKEINCNFAKFYLTRSSYTSYLKHIFKKAYKFSWVLPLFLVFTFLWAYFIAGHFDYHYHYELEYATFRLPYLQNFGLFMLGYLFISFILTLFYANLTLICAKGNKNIILTLVESYLLFVLIEFILEVGIGIFLFEKLLKIPTYGFFNIIDYYGFSVPFGMPQYIFFCVVLFIISLFVVLLIYKNKEKTIIRWEK